MCFFDTYFPLLDEIFLVTMCGKKGIVTSVAERAFFNFLNVKGEFVESFLRDFFTLQRHIPLSHLLSPTCYPFPFHKNWLTWLEPEYFEIKIQKFTRILQSLEQIF